MHVYVFLFPFAPNAYPELVFLILCTPTPVLHREDGLVVVGEVAAAGADVDADVAAAAVTGATDRTAVGGVDPTVAEGGTAGAETGKKGYTPVDRGTQASQVLPPLLRT